MVVHSGWMREVAQDGRSPSGHASNLYLTAMRRNKIAHDGQPQSRPRRVSGSPESVECVPTLGVGHRDRDATAARGMAHGIRHQVANDLAHSQGIELELGQVRWRVHEEPNLGTIGLGFEARHDIDGQRSKVGGWPSL